MIGEPLKGISEMGSPFFQFNNIFSLVKLKGRLVKQKMDLKIHLENFRIKLSR